MKITFKNSFHATEYTTSLKTFYANDSDPIIALECQKAQHSDPYAIKKLTEINRALCPHHQKSCSCTAAVSN